MLRRAVSSLVILLATSCSFLGGSGLHWERNAVVLDGTSATVLALRNDSPTRVEWEVAADEAWLVLNPGRGTLEPYASASVVVAVDRAHWPTGASARLERNPGTYHARIAATTTAGDLPVDVTLIVHDEPTGDRCGSGTAASPPALEAHASEPAAVEPERSFTPPPTHLIVKFRDDADVRPRSDASSPRAAMDVALAHGLFDVRPGPGRAVEIARIPPDADLQMLIERLERDPRVAYAEPDRPLYPQAVLPDDPDLSRQWAACRFGLPEAWEISTGAVPEPRSSVGTTIAVIDSGVDVDHPDLAARMLPGYDFCPLSDGGSGSSCLSVSPEPGGETTESLHGTHVAGIAAGIGDNGRGIAGVAWGGASILPVKVFDDRGAITSESTVACAIYWSIGSTDPRELCGAEPNPNPAAILNLSLGGPGTSSTLNAAIGAAAARGVLVFAATGNSSSRAAYGGIFMPANAPHALAVGSTNSNFERSSFSRFDVYGGRTVDLMAPGGFLMSNGETVYSTIPDDNYGALGGTSMATPYVAGVAALLWASDPGMDAEEVIARLRSTAYAAPGWNHAEYGSGVVCADAALGAATRCGIAP